MNLGIDTPGRTRTPEWTRSDATGMWVLFAFTAVALTGFGVFGRDPSRLAALPSGLSRFYGVSFGFFAQVHIVLSAAVLVLVLWRFAKWRLLAALIVVYAISLGSELGGTRFGVPFGAYSYSDVLGPRWFDLVPVLIPLSWFVMAVPSFALARHVVRGGSATGRILAGSLILLVWDLSLDPAMSYVTRYWVWADAGAYYGMPLLNLVGWYVTGVALMGALHWLRVSAWLDRVPDRLMAVFYVVNVLLPLGMNAVAGLVGAVAAGAGALVLLAAIAVVRTHAARTAGDTYGDGRGRASVLEAEGTS